LKRLLRAAGLRDARLYDARHTAATLLLEQGVAPRVAMQLLGHSQISMTMHYTHVVPELATDAAVRMDAALWGDHRPTTREDGTRTAQEPGGWT
jgi:integrase